MTQPPQYQPPQDPYQQPYQQGAPQQYQDPGQYPPGPYQQRGQYQQSYAQQQGYGQQYHQGAPQGYQQPYQAPQGYQQPYQGAPQAYQQPYQAPQQQAGYPPQGQAAYQAQGQPGCRICGSGPAAPATFRAVVGAVFMHTIWTTHGPYCRDCGLHTFRRQTTKSLTGGWCSIGAIILTPIFLLMNIAARGKVANLPAPQPRMDGRGHAPLDPGPPVFQRPGAYAYPALFCLLVIAIVVSNLSASG